MNDTVIEIFPLHRSEMQLIRSLRRHTGFGEVTITLRNGMPVKIKRVMELEDIDKSS